MKFFWPKTEMYKAHCKTLAVVLDSTTQKLPLPVPNPTFQVPATSPLSEQRELAGAPPMARKQCTPHGGPCGLGRPPAARGQGVAPPTMRAAQGPSPFGGVRAGRGPSDGGWSQP